MRTKIPFNFPDDTETYELDVELIKTTPNIYEKLVLAIAEKRRKKVDYHLAEVANAVFGEDVEAQAIKEDEDRQKRERRVKLLDVKVKRAISQGLKSIDYNIFRLDSETIKSVKSYLLEKELVFTQKGFTLTISWNKE